MSAPDDVEKAVHMAALSEHQSRAQQAEAIDLDAELDRPATVRDLINIVGLGFAAFCIRREWADDAFNRFRGRAARVCLNGSLRVPYPNMDDEAPEQAREDQPSTPESLLQAPATPSPGRVEHDRP